MTFRSLAARLLLALPLLSGCEAGAADSAVIFMYHHVDDATPRSTSISRADFRQQMNLLEEQQFTVLPLMQVLDALAGDGELPDRSIAITFDDAYESVLSTALPELEQRGWPFTVFVNTDAIDRGFSGYMSWDDLRTLGERGGTIGNHSVSHAHLVRRNEGESAAEWRQRVTREINAAADRLAAETPAFLIPAFAYPYGEYRAELRAIVGELGLYGLGQHSGAAGTESDLLALPRYPVAEGLTLDEFALRARSRPLPVRYVGREQHVLDPAETRPSLSLELPANEDIRRDALACYATGQGAVAVEWIDSEQATFSVRLNNDLRPGRSKVNCTAPSAAGQGVFYWWSHLWMRRNADGSWYDE